MTLTTTGLPISVESTSYTNDAKFTIDIPSIETGTIAIHMLVEGRPELDNARMQVNGSQQGIRLFKFGTGISDRRPTQAGFWLTAVIKSEFFNAGVNDIELRLIPGGSSFSVTDADATFTMQDLYPWGTVYERYPFPDVFSSQPDPPAPASDNVQLLIDSVTLPHEGNDAFDVPLNFNFGESGYPHVLTDDGSKGPRRLDAGHDRPAGQYTEFNPWNHLSIDYDGAGAPPAGQYVEMGQMNLALLLNSGEWLTLVGPPPGAGRIFPFGSIGTLRYAGVDVIEVDGGVSRLEYGARGWLRDGDSHAHTWGRNAFLRGLTGDQIANAVSWSSAQLFGPGSVGHYYYRMGADGRLPGQTGALRALCHGSARAVTRDLEYYFATDASPATIQGWIDNNNLPPTFPTS